MLRMACTVIKSILAWDVFVGNTVNQMENSTKIREVNEFIEKCQFYCDREYGFDVILGKPYFVAI